MIMQAPVGSLLNPPDDTQVECRPLDSSDLPALAHLHAMVYSHEHAGSAMDQVSLFFSGAYGPLVREASLGAWLDDQLQGAIFVLSEPPFEDDPDCPEGSGPHIAELFVDPQHRRRGVASLLVAQAAQACAEKGLDTMTLRLDLSKAPEAFALYEYLGFATGS